MNLEYYSSLALVTSAVVYMLALFAHAAEWAAARSLRDEEPGERTRSRLVGSVEPSSPSSGRFDGTPSEEPHGSSVELLTEMPPPPDESSSGRQRVEQFGRIGVALTVVGFLLSVAGLVLRGLAAGRAPWGNMFEFTISAMVFVVAAYLIMVWRSGVRWLGLPVTLLAAIGNGLAVTVFYVAVAPLVPALHSVWFVIHIVAAAISGAAFNVGGLLSVLYLVRQRAEEGGTVRGYLGMLPNARRLDVLAYRFLAFAFPLWTFTVAAGAIWAEYAWGRYWGWDPKETWALVTWVIYAGYLHARSTAGWRGRRAAIIALIGLASFWFNFVGINLFVSGLHSYAGI
ncbi:MAG TPA: c-type cytochrome biogenesis protein CcsB [Propionibacteriaceae bacterium]|nr:c-type cytochrome biogenesis protein CcsB [Propionibacteriaceae bacterium]